MNSTVQTLRVAAWRMGVEGWGGEGRAHNPMDPEGRAQKQRALLLNLKIS